MRIVGYIATALFGLGVLAIVVLVISSTGDIMRYLRMRRM